MSESSISPSAPLIGLGMPVYNGARFIGAALRSILTQTFTEFELVICDNASTDNTQEICERYAAQDSRVRYYRNPSNIGAHPNYNRAFELARGKYFKWVPHDDELASDYLAACVQAIDENPEAVLCQAQLVFIDGEGQQLGTCRADLYAAQADSPAVRFAAAVNQPHNCYDVMAVFRRDALEKSMLLESFHGADRALIAQLTLAGPFIHVPRPLLRVRDHGERYTRAQVKPKERAAWHDARLKGKLTFPTWRLYGEYWQMVRKSALSSGERLSARRSLVLWWFSNWNAARMAVDVMAAVFPGIVGWVEKIKQSFSPAPGIDRQRKKLALKQRPGH